MRHVTRIQNVRETLAAYRKAACRKVAGKDVTRNQNVRGWEGNEWSNWPRQGPRSVYALPELWRAWSGQECVQGLDTLLPRPRLPQLYV